MINQSDYNEKAVVIIIDEDKSFMNESKKVLFNYIRRCFLREVRQRYKQVEENEVIIKYDSAYLRNREHLRFPAVIPSQFSDAYKQVITIMNDTNCYTNDVYVLNLIDGSKLIRHDFFALSWIDKICQKACFFAYVDIDGDEKNLDHTHEVSGNLIKLNNLMVFRNNSSRIIFDPFKDFDLFPLCSPADRFKKFMETNNKSFNVKNVILTGDGLILCFEDGTRYGCSTPEGQEYNPYKCYSTCLLKRLESKVNQMSQILNN